MLERFAREAREVVTDSAVQSQELGSDRIRPEHLLLAMLTTEGFLAGRGYTYEQARAIAEESGDTQQNDDAEVLKAIGIDMSAVKRAVAANIGADAWDAAGSGSRLSKRNRGRFDPAARKAIELSLREAVRMRQRRITVEHLLLGLTRDPSPIVTQIIETRMTIEQLRRAVTDSLRGAA